jgi:hypothetical protein
MVVPAKLFTDKLLTLTMPGASPPIQIFLASGSETR